MDKKDLKENIEKAIGWAASEHNYFKELKEDLAELKKNIQNAKKEKLVKGMRVAFRDYRYLGQSERRLNNYVGNVESLLDGIKSKVTVSGKVKEIEELVKHLDIEAVALVKDCSLYEGRIKDLLSHLSHNIKDHELEKAHQVLMELEEVVDDTEKWIAALSSDLKEAKKLSAEYELIYGHDLEGIEEAIKSLSPESKYDYLKHALLKSKHMPKKTKEGVWKLLDKLVCKNKRLQNGFAELLESQGKKLQAAEWYLEIEKYEKAEQIFLKLGKSEFLIRWYLKNLNQNPWQEKKLTKGEERVKEVYLKLSLWGKAADIRKKELNFRVHHPSDGNNQAHWLGEQYEEVGNWYTKSGMKNEAKEMYVKAANFHTFCGCFHLVRELYKLAGISGNELHYKMGMAYRKKDYRLSIREFKEGRVWKALGDLYNEIGKGQEAMEMYAKAKNEKRQLEALDEI